MEPTLGEWSALLFGRIKLFLADEGADSARRAGAAWPKPG
jgi:hypothetical protein